MQNDPALKACTHHEGLFLYLVLAKANLALARRKVQDVENALVV
ncbi:hypothetical protein [Delftia acidovorans]